VPQRDNPKTCYATIIMFPLACLSEEYKKKKEQGASYHPTQF